MKNFILKLLFISMLCLFIIVPVCIADTTIQIKTIIYPVESEADNTGINMMKNIGIRKWIDQNETTMKVDFTKDVIKALQQAQYDNTIEICNKGLDYSSYVSKNIVADYYYYKGFAYLMKNDYIQSIKNYNIAINQYKLENANIFYERGLARLKIQDFEGALKDYNKSISLGLKESEPLLNGNKKYNYANTEKNIQIVNKEILTYYILPQMNKYGKLAFISENIKQGVNESAVTFYNNRIKTNSKLAETYNNRGVYYLEHEDFINAFKDFQESIKINKNLKEPYYNLALYYYTNSDYKNAKQNLQKFEEIQLKSNDNYSVGKLGTSRIQPYSELDKYIDSILKANIELQLENLNTADKIYDKYNIKNFDIDAADYKFAMNYLPLLQGKAYKYIKIKKYKRAINILKSMLTADYYPKTGGDYVFRGKYSYLIPPTKETYVDFNNGYEVVENACVRNNIAVIEYIMNKKNLALEDINRAKEQAFKFNDIRLYVQIINTYNFMTLNQE